ncbi:MAG: transposase [Chloroflexota bacterium]
MCLSHRGCTQQAHWEDLLDYLQDILPSSLEVLVIADREFGFPERLGYVESKGWAYAIRLKGNAYYYDPTWKQPFDWWQLNDISPRQGNRYAIADLRLGKTDLYRFQLACAWAVGSKEPWFIATNLDRPLHALKQYARRFGCEELFSDLKKRGFNWENSRIRCPKRMARFILALALLVFFLLALARRLRLQQLDLELTSPSHRTRLSLFQTARRWLLRRLAQHQLPDQLFDFHLRRFA